MTKLTAEDPKLKMMQKVMDKVIPPISNPQANLDELLTAASMAMETWLDSRLISTTFSIVTTMLLSAKIQSTRILVSSNQFYA